MRQRKVQRIAIVVIGFSILCFISGIAIFGFDFLQNATNQTYTKSKNLDPATTQKTLEELARSGSDRAKEALSYFTGVDSLTLPTAEVKDPSLVEHNLLLAHSIIGAIYYDKEEYSAAFPWLKSAAEKRHKPSARLLSKLYATGAGTAKDKDLAQYWQDFALRHSKDDIPGVNAP